jgi:hypothetical protein
MTIPITTPSTHPRRLLRSAAAVYITARLTPRNPMRRALGLGVLGTVVGTAGAIATIPMHLGPSWYPIPLALTGLPLTWLGGASHRRRQTS